MFKLVSALMVLMATFAPSASASQCKKWFKDAHYSGHVIEERTGDKKWCKKMCKKEIPGCNAVNFEKAWNKCTFLQVDPHASTGYRAGVRAFKFCEKRPREECGAQWQKCCSNDKCDGGLSCFNGQCEPCGGHYQPCCPNDGCHANRHSCGKDGRCNPCGRLWDPVCPYHPECDGMMMRNGHDPHNPTCSNTGDK